MEQIQTEYGIFTNNNVTGQTAEEVYQEWLVNKDKPPQPTEIDYLLDLDYRISMIELGL